ncbi:hypothetical protein AX17_003565 [Amanita inopinata Kibby_2008]|nr:hypothetical protein AX17_003565 [Amanita inopinata Kibby_2008]
MSPSPLNASTASIRRSRAVLVVLLTAVAFVILVSRFQLVRSLPETSLYRENIISYFGTSKPDVDEIYGLLHLVTTDVERRYTLSNAVEINPTEPIDFSVYAGGRKWVDWKREVKRLNTNYPVVVFSKTYCPYSLRAKKILASYDIQPPPYIVEVDLRDDGNIIKTLLTRMTNRSTFPNILVQGKSIGGSDDLLSLHQSRSFEKILLDAGAVVRMQNI